MITHTAKGDIVSGCTRATRAALCAEVAKLGVSVLDGKLLALAQRSEGTAGDGEISWAL